MLTHRGLSNLIRAHFNIRGLPRKSRLAVRNASFDASLSELFMTWGAGATLVLAPRSRLIPGRN